LNVLTTFLLVLLQKGIPHVANQATHIIHSKTKIVNVNDEKDVIPKMPQMCYSHEKQTLMCRDNIINIGIVTSIKSNNPRSRACKFPNVQGKPNKNLQKQKKVVVNCRCYH